MVGKAGTSQRKYSNLLYPAAIWNSCFFFFFKQKCCNEDRDTYSIHLHLSETVPKTKRSVYVPAQNFPGGSKGKESVHNARDLGLIPQSGRSPRDGNHSDILAWRIPWTEEPGGLQTTGLQRVEYSWATNIFTFKYMLNTRKTTLMFTCDVGLTSFYTSESDFAWASL